MPRRARVSTPPTAEATEAGAPSQWGNLPGGPADEQVPDPLAGWRTLPPPGHERDEELRRRKDELDQKGALLAEQLGTERVDPAKLEPDYNVRSESYADKYGNLRQDGELEISNMQPGMKYAWIRRDFYGTGTSNWQTTYMRRMGWEVVRGDMPEAQDRSAADGTRHNQDCHLMRIPTELDDENCRKNRIYRQWRETGVSQELLEQADKHGNNIWTMENAPPALQAALSARLSSRGVSANPAVNQMAAKHLALRALDRNIRAGTLPGLQMRR